MEKNEEKRARYSAVRKDSLLLFRPENRAPDTGISIPTGPRAEETGKKLPTTNPSDIDRTPNCGPSRYPATGGKMMESLKESFPPMILVPIGIKERTT